MLSHEEYCIKADKNNWVRNLRNGSLYAKTNFKVDNSENFGN